MTFQTYFNDSGGGNFTIDLSYVDAVPTGSWNTGGYGAFGGPNVGSWSYAIDNDEDGLPDEWEARWGGGGDLDPTVDQDGDGWDNLREYTEGTLPLVLDTDRDSVNDGLDPDPLNYGI